LIPKVSGCPDIIIPFLTPEEVSDYTKNLKAGHRHFPIVIEEGYINGGHFVFNRGKTFLFAIKDHQSNIVNAPTKKELTEREDNLLKKYLTSRKDDLKEDLDNSYDSEDLYQKVKRALVNSNNVVGEIHSTTLQIRVEVLDISKYPTKILGVHTTSVEVKPYKKKLKPVLKENIVLKCTNELPFCELGIGITVQFFQKKSKRSKYSSSISSLVLQAASSEERNKDVEYKTNVNFEKAIINLLKSSNRLWENNILYENPYILKYMEIGPNKSKTIQNRNLACYLESHYDDCTSSITEERIYDNQDNKPTRSDYFHEEHPKYYEQLLSACRDTEQFRPPQPRHIREHKSRKAHTKDEIPTNTLRTSEDIIKDLEMLPKYFKDRKPLIKPSGWLGRPAKSNVHQIPVIQQTRTTFLRRTLVDPELSKQMQAEIDRKLTEEMKKLGPKTVRKNRPIMKSKISNVDRSKDFSQQTEGENRTKWKEDKYTSIGNSLGSTTDSPLEIRLPKENHYINRKLSIQYSGSVNDELDILSPDLKVRNPMIRSDTKESAATLEKINSLNEETADVSKASAVSSQSIFFLKSSNPLGGSFEEDKGKDSLGKTYTISQDNFASNIHNASELGKSNPSTAEGSKTPVYQSDSTLGSGFKDFIPRDLSDELEMIEESAEYYHYSSKDLSDQSIHEEINSQDSPSEVKEIETLMSFNKDQVDEDTNYLRSTFGNDTISAGELLLGSSSNIFFTAETLSTGQLVSPAHKDSGRTSAKSASTSSHQNSESAASTVSRRKPQISPKQVGKKSETVKGSDKELDRSDNSPKIHSEEEQTISNISAKIAALRHRRKSLPRQRLNTDSVSSYVPSDMEDSDLNDNVYFEDDYEYIEKELKKLS